jgi:uncharacterized lipoprotein YajG
MSYRWSVIVGMSAAVIALSGCIPRPQLVRLAPPVSVKAAEGGGSGATVGVAAFDVRPDQKLGVITDAHDHRVPVTVTRDATAGLYQSVTQAMARMGYKTKPLANDDAVTLTVELHELSFNALKRTADFEITLKVVMSANARNGVNTYDRAFTVNQRKLAGGPTTEAETTSMVNDAVGLALSDMLADQELTGVLSH